jgi:hypothetical protein
MPDDQQSKDDFEKPFLRARRTIRHLFHVYRGDKEFNPNGCDGCKEIHRFLTTQTIAVTNISRSARVLIPIGNLDQTKWRSLNRD